MDQNEHENLKRANNKLTIYHNIIQIMIMLFWAYLLGSSVWNDKNSFSDVFLVFVVGTIFFAGLSQFVSDIFDHMKINKKCKDELFE